jgi:cytochrome c-type biogenesis protein CcmH
MRALILVVWCMLAASATASIGVYEFDSPQQESRFKQLSEELRCLVCQNQSLADSNAELALDLRRQVHDMIRSGSSDAEIIGFMTQRYGDFVLYRPPFRASTILLWAGPFVLFLLGMIVLGRLVRQRAMSAGSADAPLDAAERKRLEQMLRREEKG